MNAVDSITIPLAEAYLCADMERPHIGTNPHRCDICGSQVICLAKVLDREEKKEPR